MVSSLCESIGYHEGHDLLRELCGYRVFSGEHCRTLVIQVARSATITKTVTSPF